MMHTWVDETKAQAQGRWREILATLGVDVPAGEHKHGPCPGCGGKDRFRFDDRNGRGTFICSMGGGEPLAGDGFALLHHVHGWNFMETARQVADVLGISPTDSPIIPTRNETIDRQRQRLGRIIQEKNETKQKREKAKAGIEDVLAGCLPIAQVPAAMAYLRSRGIPDRFIEGSLDLLAHPGLDYFHRPSREAKTENLGRFPAMIGVCRAADGEIVTLHRTYLTPDGKKLFFSASTRPGESPPPSRKLMTPATDLPYHIALFAPVQGKLGVAEGIETAISAGILHDVPCHSAIDSGKLIHYIPPVGISVLYIFADPDPAGKHGAENLKARLKIDRPQLRVEIRYPAGPGLRPGSDWNDVLVARARPRDTMASVARKRGLP